MMSTTLFEQEAIPQLEALQQFAYRLCRDEQYSRDLVQETMLKACSYFDSYQKGTNCKAWLFQICKNSFINEYRRRQRAPVALDYQDEEFNPASDPRKWHSYPSLLYDDSSLKAQEQLFGDEVQGALNELPAGYRTAVLLSDIEGFSYEEIAAFMKVPIGTVRSRIFRGRRRLATKLSGKAQ